MFCSLIGEYSPLLSRPFKRLEGFEIVSSENDAIRSSINVKNNIRYFHKLFLVVYVILVEKSVFHQTKLIEYLY